MSTKAQERFCMIPHWVMLSEVSDGAIRLYGVLMKYADYDTHEAYPSRTAIARDMHKSVDTVDRLVKELTDAKMLRVDKRTHDGTGWNRSSVYTLTVTNPHANDPGQDDADMAANLRPRSRTDAAQNDTHRTTPISPSLRSPSPLRDEYVPSLRSPSLSERRSERPLIEIIRDIARAQPGDEYEAAVHEFTDRFEETHGVEAPQWEDGWGASLARCVKDLGTARGTSKLLGVYTNTAYSQ